MRTVDFWALHPKEFNWLVDATRPVKMYGSMTEDQVAAEYERVYGDK